MDIDKIVVVGAGTMGSGISQVLAIAGYRVVMIDVADGILKRAVKGIEKSLKRMAEQETISQGDLDIIRARITAATDLKSNCSDADLAIESIPEVVELKQEMFTALDRWCPEHTLLASNTSQINISTMAGRTGRLKKVAGMHWFNPPPMMPLVELIRTPDTADETIKILTGVAERCKKQVIICRDGTGFITSRAFAAGLLEGIRMYEEGLASKEDIDAGIKLGLNYPMGPLELADFVGLDVVYHASKGMVEAYGDRFRVPQVLVNLVLSGHLGIKSGRGFYRWKDGRKVE